MVKSLTVFVSFLLFFSISCATKQTADLSNGDWVDLSYDFSSDTIYWVTAEPFDLKIALPETK